MESPRRPARGRRPSAVVTRLSSDPVVRGMIAVFPLVRLLGVITASPVWAADSSTYRRPNSFLDFSLTSFDGQSVRPWGVTVWMALWPSNEAVLIAQVVLSIIAWSTLALTLASVLQRPAVRRVTVAGVLVLACTAQVTAWDANILCESVSISTGVLSLAACIRFTRRPTWGRGAVLVVTALWFSMTRPNVFPVLLAWAFTMLVVGVLKRRILLWGVVAGLLIAVSVYTYVYNVRSDPAWSKKFGFSRTTVAYAYPIAANDPVAEAVLADVRTTDAPRCMIPATVGEVAQHGTTAWVRNTVRACPGMDAWASANWNRWWTSWLLHHPSKMLQIIHAELPNSLSPPVYANVMAPAPEFVGSTFFGSPEIPQPNQAGRSYRTEPLLLWLGAIGALGIAGRRRMRGTAWPSDLVVLAGIAGGLGSAVSSGLLIQAAPDGVGRESAGVSVLLAASCVALVGLGLNRLTATAPVQENTAPVLDRTGPVDVQPPVTSGRPNHAATDVTRQTSVISPAAPAPTPPPQPQVGDDAEAREGRPVG